MGIEVGGALTPRFKTWIKAQSPTAPLTFGRGWKVSIIREKMITQYSLPTGAAATAMTTSVTSRLAKFLRERPV